MEHLDMERQSWFSPFQISAFVQVMFFLEHFQRSHLWDPKELLKDEIGDIRAFTENNEIVLDIRF